MFAGRYFAARYFAPRYWPQIGAEAITTPGIEVTLPGGRLHATMDEGRLHVTIPGGRLHATMADD